MTSAVRSPGSTLKPIIYGLAFEAGLAHPETLIEDRPARFGLYVPKNFDQDWHGTVTIRMALAQSLNIPAVKVLDAIGPQKLYGRFAQVGIAPVLPKGAEPSLAIALGGLGLRLVRSRRALCRPRARRRADRSAIRRDAAHAEGSRGSRSGCCRRSPPGTWPTSCATRRHPPTPSPARSPTRPARPTASATPGRSGYDGRYTIAVWVGRPDGAATPGLTGRIAAAPLLFDAFAHLSTRRAPLASAPSGAMTAAGQRPAAAAQALPRGQGRRHVRRISGTGRADRLPARSLGTRCRGQRRRAASSSRPRVVRCR